jgi:hypothetical protein
MSLLPGAKGVESPPQTLWRRLRRGTQCKIKVLFAEGNVEAELTNTRPPCIFSSLFSRRVGHRRRNVFPLRNTFSSDGTGKAKVEHALNNKKSESPIIAADPYNCRGVSGSLTHFLIEIPSSLPPWGLSHWLLIASQTPQTSEHFP